MALSEENQGDINRAGDQVPDSADSREGSVEELEELVELLADLLGADSTKAPPLELTPHSNGSNGKAGGNASGLDGLFLPPASRSEPAAKSPPSQPVGRLEEDTPVEGDSDRLFQPAYPEAPASEHPPGVPVGRLEEHTPVEGDSDRLFQPAYPEAPASEHPPGVPVGRLEGDTPVEGDRDRLFQPAYPEAPASEHPPGVQVGRLEEDTPVEGDSDRLFQPAYPEAPASEHPPGVQVGLEVLDTAVEGTDSSAVQPPQSAPAENTLASNDNLDALIAAIDKLPILSPPRPRREKKAEELPLSQENTEELIAAFDNFPALLEFPQNWGMPAEESRLSEDNLEEPKAALESLLIGREQPQLRVERAEDPQMPVAVAEDDGGNPVERLQNLLFGDVVSDFERVKNLLLDSELPEVRQLLGRIEHKLGNLEHQIYDPDELIKLLLPWIAELLSLKIAESKEEVVRAIVPIIDEVIKGRSKENKEAMSAAIADLIPAAISRQISNSPREIARAIGPEIGAAIREQIRVDREEIVSTLAPEMGAAIKEQINLERDAMVDALYPVIGSTISKYLAEAIRAINEKVANAFSPQGLYRKLRAKIQGVSEGELILTESMPYIVQAVFLIHKGSGLVIAEAQRSDSQRLESEMVAGMLTAIRSFVNDCIVQSGEIAELDQIDYGGSKIVLEVAGYCYLAVVIKGEPPKPFIGKLRDTLSTIVLKYGKSIETFDGDPDTVPPAVPKLLEALMEIAAREKKAKVPVALLGIGLGILGLILVLWGIAQYRSGIDRRISQRAATAIAEAPELAVYRLSVGAEGGTLKLAGKLPNQELRSIAERIALAAAPGVKLENKIIAVDVPPDPVLVAGEVKRLTAVLNKMDGVSISTSYDERTVTVGGTVSLRLDAEKITAALKQIPGVQSVVSAVEINPLAISSRIYFDEGSDTLSPAYQETIVKIKEFLNRYPQKSLRIVGHSDPTGTRAQNQELALARASEVRDALVRQGIDARRLQVAGSANPPADVESSQPLLLSRCVRFEPLD
ncbi:MAG: OmpA family protein [Oscillatoria princeps RMCB-10]|jgi:outer membrane protein OmpA-like peptidoglycan-associated protein|nr:OmpA family protein [Oscillatoria princeps RMCB-10]